MHNGKLLSTYVKADGKAVQKKKNKGNEKMNEELVLQVKEIIIEALNLEEVTPEDIETEAPLFGDGLGLDSIDALELGLAVKNKFGVAIKEDSEEVRKNFYSVATLVKYIEENRK
jgi:acyl carrier protein